MSRGLRLREFQCLIGAGRCREVCWRRLRLSRITRKKSGNSGMTTFRGMGVLATALLMLSPVTACAKDGRDPSSNPTASATRTAPPSPSPESEKASEAASATVRRYYGVRNRLRQNPKESLSLLGAVAISSELAAQRNLFKKERERGLHQVGNTKVAELEVQSVDLDNSDPKAGMVPTVQIDLCFDVTDVDVVDADGKSVVDSGRPDTGWIQFLVSNYEWDTDPKGGWRVASSKDIEREPCDAR
jgi:hypothetical protein